MLSRTPDQLLASGLAVQPLEPGLADQLLAARCTVQPLEDGVDVQPLDPGLADQLLAASCTDQPLEDGVDVQPLDPGLADQPLEAGCTDQLLAETEPDGRTAGDAWGAAAPTVRDSVVLAAAAAIRATAVRRGLMRMCSSWWTHPVCRQPPGLR